MIISLIQRRSEGWGSNWISSFDSCNQDDVWPGQGHYKQPTPDNSFSSARCQFGESCSHLKTPYKEKSLSSHHYSFLCISISLNHLQGSAHDDKKNSILVFSFHPCSDEIKMEDGNKLTMSKFSSFSYASSKSLFALALVASCCAFLCFRSTMNCVASQGSNKVSYTAAWTRDVFLTCEYFATIHAIWNRIHKNDTPH